MQNRINLKPLPMDLGLREKKIKLEYHRIILMIKMKLKEHICKEVIVNLLVINFSKTTLVGCSLI
jgi:hypothetical protein